MKQESASRQIYWTRLDRVIIFINDNLQDKLSLAHLADVALFSPFHFHRIFTALLGETPNAYINRIRLERAANMLQTSLNMSITDIALSTGFSSSAAFSRSFKQHFGSAPSVWKEQNAYPADSLPRGKNSNQLDQEAASKRFIRFDAPAQVTVKHMPAFHVACVASRKGYQIQQVQTAWKALCRWAGPRDLLRPETSMLGISYDNPDITPGHKCRYYACLTVPDRLHPDDTVGIMDIDSGKYAVSRFEGPVEGIQQAFRSLYAGWLPDSGFQPAHKPCYELYLATPDTHPDGRYILDICLPVEPI